MVCIRAQLQLCRKALFILGFDPCCPCPSAPPSAIAGHWSPAGSRALIIYRRTSSAVLRDIPWVLLLSRKTGYRLAESCCCLSYCLRETGGCLAYCLTDSGGCLRESI